MEYRYLGRSGTKVSELCLGCMTFGREASEEDSHRILDRFVDAGGTFLDTANVYGKGGSEEIVGSWLARRNRYDIVLATKVRFPMGSSVNDTGASRKHILHHLDESLRRLKTDHVDLYQLHCWDRGTDLAETLQTLDGLVRSGKVRYIGASNYVGWHLQKALEMQRSAGWERFVSLQPQYNLLCRTTEWELLPIAEQEGLAVLPWSPLRGGWLTGKYKRNMETPPNGTRAARDEEHGGFNSWSLLDRESTWTVLDALAEVASDTGKTQAQVALNWLLRRPAVTAPIVGVRTVEHLEQALGAVGWSLSDGHERKLQLASEPEQVYPYDFVFWAQDGR